MQLKILAVCAVAGLGLATPRAYGGVEAESRVTFFEEPGKKSNGITVVHPQTDVNATVGAKWANGKVVTSLKGTNLLNQTVQQHTYGDILKLGVVAEVRVFVK